MRWPEGGHLSGELKEASEQGKQHLLRTLLFLLLWGLGSALLFTWQVPFPPCPAHTLVLLAWGHILSRLRSFVGGG